MKKEVLSEVYIMQLCLVYISDFNLNGFYVNTEFPPNFLSRIYLLFGYDVNST